MAQTFVDNGKLYPLDELLQSDAAWESNFKEGVFSNFTIDSKVYGVPFQVTNTCVFYNKDLFAQAGITEFPSTWAGLLEAVDKLKAIDVVPIALGNKEKWNAESVIFSTLANRFTGTDWYQSIREKSGAKFTDPDFVSALTALDGLAKAGAFNTDVNSIDGAQQRQMYMNGKAAMTIDGSWAIADFDANSPEDVKNATEIAALPSVDGGKGEATAITGGAGWAYAVNANIAPEKVEAVKALIIALTGPEYATAAVKAGTLTAAQPSEYQQETSKIIATKFDAFATGRSFIPVYDHQLNSSIIEVMNSGLQELLIGTVSPEELAQRIQTEYER
jgi:raffinose/stachyose/melibiose transport system substrate-binding protein